jgi:hypothetical protein
VIPAIYIWLRDPERPVAADRWGSHKARVMALLGRLAPAKAWLVAQQRRLEPLKAGLQRLAPFMARLLGHLQRRFPAVFGH